MTIVVPSSIRVLMPNGRVTEMKLETYLAGAVVAEMGANAPLEALKAQAVASRTYAAAAHRHADVGADVCTTAHCQEWKRVDPIVAPEVFRAVSETWGTVVAFDGKLIDAFFFDHCDGHTRSASDVHMSPAPYLQSVSCDCGFVALNGHGVGLCQRGAIVMARRGASFEEILQHYYSYVTIVHTSRERGDTKSIPATPSVPASAHPTQIPAHKRKSSPSSAHKGKIAHKPIPPRRSAQPIEDKPEPEPVKRKAPPSLPPLPPFLMKKVEAEKKAAPKPAPHTPPPSPPLETKVEQTPPVEPPSVSAPIEPQQLLSIPPPSVETNDVPEGQSPPREPIVAEAPRIELLPPVAPAPVGPSEPVAAPAEPASQAAVPPQPVASTPMPDTVASAETVAQVSTEPVAKALEPEVAAQSQTQAQVEMEPGAGPSVEPPLELEVPAYVAGLNDPSLLAQLPTEAPAAEPLAEPPPTEMSAAAVRLPEPTQEALSPAEPPSEPCAPDTLPELTLSTLKMGKPVRVHIDHLPGERMIAGCLSVPGIMITVLDQRGNETLVMSGSAPHYGEGGFETVVEEDGCYVVWIDGEAIKLEVRCNTAFIHII